MKALAFPPVVTIGSITSLLNRSLANHELLVEFIINTDQSLFDVANSFAAIVLLPPGL